MDVSVDFGSAFEASPAPSMILDQNFKFVAANATYLKMVGKTASDVQGKYVFDVFPETDDRVASMLTVFNSALAGNDAVIEEIPFRITVNDTVIEQWWTARHAKLPAAHDNESYIIQYSENVTDQVRLREMRNALMGEMQHRIGNIFAIVGGIARQTGRAVTTLAEFLPEFENRITSLMKVNRQLTKKGEIGDTIASVVNNQLAVHTEEARARISVQGPDYPLSMHQSQAISMAVHELATNSMKYGAIGTESGALNIHWDVLPNNGCLFRWEEHGGADSDKQEKTGYGTLLLTTIIPRQLGGSAVREIKAGTFRYSLEIAGD